MNWRVIFGAVAWLGCGVAAQAGITALGTVEMMFLLAPLVIVPLALELTGRIAPELPANGVNWLMRAQPVAAVCAVTAFFFPVGAVAAGFAAAWAAFCAATALVALVSVVKSRPGTLPEWCVVMGMGYLPVGGLGFVMSRAGIAPMGIEEPIVLLTGVHFHYTAFAAAVVAGAVGAAIAGRRAAWFRASATGLLAGTPLLGIGFALWLPAVKLAAVAMIVAGVIGLAGLTLAELPRVRGAARSLLTISAITVLFGMALASAYGLGEFRGESYVGLAEMARYHGVANGIGFTLCGLLGWKMALAKREVRNDAGD